MFGSPRQQPVDGDIFAPSQQNSSDSSNAGTSATSLSWELRIQTFLGLFSLSIIASFCASYLLVLTKVTGFCIMTSISAILSLSSTCFLMGPVGQLKKMFHKSRWIASSLYLAMILMTIISGLFLKSSLLAIIFTVLQYIAMAWYSMSYIPYARKRSGAKVTPNNSSGEMSFIDHLEAMRKEMNHISTQIQQQKLDIEKAKNEVVQQKAQLQTINETGQQVQLEVMKHKEMVSKLEGLARGFLPMIEDPNSQMQMMQEIENVQKASAMQSMQMAAAAAMPMMMRPPMMGGMDTPRSKANGSNMMAAAMQSPQMQMQQMMQQQAAAMAMAQASMMGIPMQPMMGMGGMPGMPGMGGMPMGHMMMNPAAAAAAMAQHHQFNQQLAATSVSTPSRNQSTSGAMSRTRTPLTASTTSSPRPAESAKEELSAQNNTSSAAVVSTTGSQSPQQVTTTTNNEENSIAVV